MSKPYVKLDKNNAVVLLVDHQAGFVGGAAVRMAVVDPGPVGCHSLDLRQAIGQGSNWHDRRCQAAMRGSLAV